MILDEVQSLKLTQPWLNRQAFRFLFSPSYLMTEAECNFRNAVVHHTLRQRTKFNGSILHIIIHNRQKTSDTDVRWLRQAAGTEGIQLVYLFFFCFQQNHAS
jgi:hypothetical protein